MLRASIIAFSTAVAVLASVTLLADKASAWPNCSSHIGSETKGCNVCRTQECCDANKGAIRGGDGQPCRIINRRPSPVRSAPTNSN